MEKKKQKSNETENMENGCTKSKMSSKRVRKLITQVKKQLNELEQGLVYICRQKLISSGEDAKRKKTESRRQCQNNRPQCLCTAGVNQRRNKCAVAFIERQSILKDDEVQQATLKQSIERRKKVKSAKKGCAKTKVTADDDGQLAIDFSLFTRRTLNK